LWRLQGRVEVDETEFGGSLGGVARLTISYVMRNGKSEKAMKIGGALWTYMSF